MRILIVEDNQATAETLATLLTQCKYAVDVADDGQAAAAMVEAFAYDLLLLDVMLPRLDGITLCRQLRNQGYEMPILLLTGKDSGHDKAIGLDAGADDYVVKPFDIEELEARIRALLRRGQFGREPILAWGGVNLDPGTTQTCYQEQTIPLTPKEYALLELFMRNPRHVFSCAMLLEHLWSYAEMPGEEAVRTHIKGLRHKLKAAGVPANFIETVYGIGYRLRDLAELDKPADAKTKAPLAIGNKKSMAEVISSVWDRYQTRISDQVGVLEALALALAAQKTIQTQQQQQAEQEAHSLAGALGLFGLTQGTVLAREIEQLLKAPKPLTAKQIHQLQTDILALRQVVDQPSSPANGYVRSPTTVPQNDAIVRVNPLPPVSALPGVDRYSAQLLRAEIMILGADQPLLDQLGSLLAPWDIRVTLVSEPQQFWPSLTANSPNLLILDLDMPHVRGIELCQQVRANRYWCHLPTLVLTSDTQVAHIRHIFEVGADDFVSKPIAGPELVVRLGRCLQQSRLEDTLTQVSHRQ